MQMIKKPDKYYDVDPWLVIENGFDPKRQRNSESIFTLANEHMCVRGYFEEGYSGDSLLGSYFNQLYDYRDLKYPMTMNGFVDKGGCVPNAVDWLYTRIELDGELLDLANSTFSDFRRVTNMKDATLTRGFVWHTKSGKQLKLMFTRFLNMQTTSSGYQKIRFEPLNFSGSLKLVSGLDFNTEYEIAGGFDYNQESGADREGVEDLNYWIHEKSLRDGGLFAIQAKTKNTKTSLFSSFRLELGQETELETVEGEKFIGCAFTLGLKENEPVEMEKTVLNYWGAGESGADTWQNGMSAAQNPLTYDSAYEEHAAAWQRYWDMMDIEIEGDPEILQGVRFCNFMCLMNYHGESESRNCMCKLGGEVYQGWNFWDTEIYCERMYLFMDPEIARKLIMYRYRFLPEALEEGVRLGCEGARYPFGTVTGRDDTGAWQHCDLEIHQNVAIFYSIWHYAHVTGDKTLLYREGIEILLQMCRCMASLGGWSPKRGDFGFYGVMGPDEFHMMVNNNCYTNVMAQKMFRYTVEVLDEMLESAPELFKKAVRKTGVTPLETQEWLRMAEHMRVNKDEATGVYEQHDGYFDLPHIDLSKLPIEQIPIYKNWPYVKIFRFNMLKQPDFLNLLYFFSSDYSTEEKKANYEFYEERTVHESSMSPALHSILAAELGKLDEAYAFLQYAACQDLSNYNLNTDQGLHSTASAGVWASVVSGFGGLRTDADVLTLNPVIPPQWKRYTFRLFYRGSRIEVCVTQECADVRLVSGPPVNINIWGKMLKIGKAGRLAHV